MFSYGTHRESVQGLLEDDSDETAVDILSWTVRVLDYVTKHFDFSELAESEDVTADTDGVIVLPALRSRVNSIALKASPYTPFLFGEWIEMEVGRKSYFTYLHSSPAISNSDGLTVAVTQGSATVTSVALFGSIEEGQAISFTGIDGLFKASTIASSSSMIISPYYPGESGATTVYATPAGVHEAILHYCGATVSEVVVKIKYQMRHPEIYDDDNCIVLVPMPQTILLMTLQWALLREKYDVDADRLKDDIADALKIEIGTAGATEAVPITGMNAGNRRPLFALKKGRLPDRWR